MLPNQFKSAMILYSIHSTTKITRDYFIFIQFTFKPVLIYGASSIQKPPEDAQVASNLKDINEDVGDETANPQTSRSTIQSSEPS